MSDVHYLQNLRKQRACHQASLTRKSRHPYLLQAREKAAGQQLGYAGGLTPECAWILFTSGTGFLVDIRDDGDWERRGYVPNSLHIPWVDDPGSPASIAHQIVNLLPHKEAVLLFLCSDGSLATKAARRATEVGFRHSFVVLGGFDGLPDDRLPESQGGWRFQGLPWVKNWSEQSFSR